MTDYDKKYIPWFVIAAVIGLLIGFAAKYAILLGIPGAADSNEWELLARLCVPAGILIGIFIALAKYRKDKVGSNGEEDC